MDKKAVLIGVLTFMVLIIQSLLNPFFESLFRHYLNITPKHWAIKFITPLVLSVIAILLYIRIESIKSTTPQEWLKDKRRYEEHILQLEQDKKTLQKRAEHLEKLNEQLKELQDLFYILVRHGKVSVSNIMKRWEEKYGKDSAFVVYEKGRGFNLKKNDNHKKKHLLEKLPKKHNIELNDEDKINLWKLLQDVLMDRSPFSKFLNEEYSKFSAPLFESSPPEPFHLIVFPRELRISPKELARIFQEEYLKYANELKKRLKSKLNALVENLPESPVRNVIKLIMDDIEQWNPSEGVLLIFPFSAAEIPFGKFSEDALSLLEKYHPHSLETIKEELTKTILKNLTLSAFLEYAGLHPHKIKELESHEDEIRDELRIKQWGELFKIDHEFIRSVFSQYNVTEEELKRILNAVEKITEIIERPDRIIRR